MPGLKLDMKIKFQGLFLKDPVKAIKIYEEEMKKGFEQSTSLILREVDKRTPRGVTGHLAGSLFREVRNVGMDMFGVVATPLFYAKRVEEGIPYDPNFASLLEWVRIKLGLSGSHAFAVTKVIRRNISKRGQKVAKWMFERGFQAGKLKALKIMERARDKVVTRWQ